MLELLSAPHIQYSLLLTAKTCLFVLALFLAIGPGIGLLLARKSGLAVRLLGTLVTLPLVFPPVALGYLLLTALGRTGPLGTFLAEYGFSLLFNDASLVIAGFVAGLPLVVRPLQTAFASHRLQELEEAASVLGADRLTVFRRVTLPLIRPSLAVGLLMGTARVSGEVGITMMLGGNIAGKTNTLSLEIFNAVSRADFDEATALTVLLSFFAALIFLTLEVLLKKSVKL